MSREKLKVLDLFSGIGGFSLGLERTGGFETVAFCEIDPFCRRVLVKHWPNVPCHNDVTTLRGEDVGTVDVICGGFPCQDISSAGLKVGISGSRSGLWKQYARLLGEIRPRFAIVENVGALMARGLDVVLGDLSELGFDAEWHIIRAADLGAWHGRPRVWIIAYPNQGGQSGSPEHDEACGSEAYEKPFDASTRPLAVHMARAWGEQKPLPWDRVWPDENSPMGMGMDDGVPERLDRLSHLGNAVVPQIPELIGNAILESLNRA